MKNYPEWESKKRLIDLRNRYCTLYENEDGSKFYIEPAFYTTLETFKVHYPDRINDILAEMDRAVKANKFVVFTADDEKPLTFVPENVEAVYLEITDITNKLKIFLEDKSRGSDYGD